MPSDAPLMQITQLFTGLQGYWWPFCRIMAMFSLAPPFNHRGLPIRARVLLALGLTIALGAALPASPHADPLSAHGLLLTLEQVVFGLCLGLAMQWVFSAFSIAAEVLATQMGMSMARYNDPVNGFSSSSIIYQLYFILLIFLFLAIDGHLIVVSVLFKSFSLWPVGSGLNLHSYRQLLVGVGWMFSAALLVSLPLVFCLFLVQFCFGLLNRISPAMNLFSLGFPLMILMGLLGIWLTLPNLPHVYLQMTHEMLDGLGILLRESNG